MKFNPGAAIILVVIAASGVVIFQSSDRPDLLRAVVGCFRSSTAGGAMVVRINSNGEFITPLGQTTISVTEDKNGLSILPAKKVIAQDRGALITGGYPMLLRLSPDRRSFIVPGEDVPDVRFERTACR